jgi:hypothetical protein
MNWGAWFYPHTVVVRDALGAGGMGDGYGPPRTVAAEVKDQQTLVRDRDGREVVSSTQVTLSLPEHVPVGSLVTVWAGRPAQREARVLAVAVRENGGPLDDHLLLSLE